MEKRYWMSIGFPELHTHADNLNTHLRLFGIIMNLLKALVVSYVLLFVQTGTLSRVEWLSL
jgi:hypothetical protein